MTKAERRQEVLEIIEENPGATGAVIFMKLAKRHWLGRWLGPDSLWTILFGPSLGSIYVHLLGLEDEGLIRGEWGLKVQDRPRRRHYYSVTNGDRT